MTYEQAIERLRALYHGTRLTPMVQVPADVVNAILYGEKDKS